MHHWNALTWYEIRDRAANGALAVLPIGCVETQGPYTPVGLEHVLAERLASEVARRVDGVALPGLPYGNSDTFRHFPGTIYLPAEILVELYFEVLMSIVKSGFDRIFCIVMHAANQPLVERAAQKIREQTGVVITWINPGAVAGGLVPTFFPGKPSVRGHGAEPGASLARFLYGLDIPPTAEWTEAPESFRDFQFVGASLMAAGIYVGYPLLWEELFAERGGFGDPTQGSKDIGAAIFDQLVGISVEVARAYIADNRRG